MGEENESGGGKGGEDGIAGNGGCPWANLAIARNQLLAKSSLDKLLYLAHHPPQSSTEDN